MSNDESKIGNKKFIKRSDEISIELTESGYVEMIQKDIDGIAMRIAFPKELALLVANHICSLADR